MEDNGKLVLVTGGSGFIAAYCILQLLKEDYRVRTTVRSLKREANVRVMLKVGGVEHEERLSFVEAELMSDAGWAEAVAGCDFVLHVASPFPAGVPKNEDELIIPAREGALRVLKAARDAGVKRVVLTSSFAAIGYTPKSNNEPYTEKDWTNPNDKIGAYTKSKTIAEKAAWDFIAREGKGLELSVVNPVGVLGPVLGPDYSTSIQLVQRLLEGSVPGIPHLSFGLVDVRDVADLHLRAMTNPVANGERFLAIAEDIVTMQHIAEVLKAKLGAAADRVPTKTVPNWLLRLAAVFDPSIRLIIPELGKTKRATNEKARRMLGWNPLSNEMAILATAESLIRLDLLNKKKQA